MNIQTDRALIPARSTSTRYLTVDISAPVRERAADRPSVRVALVLDRSGSMAGRKLDMARAAVVHALRLLSPRDRAAVVCYDTEIDTLLAAAPVTDDARADAEARLARIDARGSTDLCGGWMRGAGLIADRAGRADSDTAAPARVLLLTDGLANHGETDPDALARRAADLRARGIVTSTFGLGADFDEQVMSRIATDGGGHFYFIEQPAQIPDFFTSELGETLDVVARDARLVVAGHGGVTLSCLNGLAVEPARPGEAPEWHVRLGDLVSGQHIRLTLALECTPGSDSAAIGVSLRLADRDRALFTGPITVAWQVADQAENAAQPVNTGVLTEAARQIAGQARATAVVHNRAGRYDDAARILGEMAGRLGAIAGEVPHGVPEIEALAAELDVLREEFAAPVTAMRLKSQFFQSYSLAHSRDTSGRARRAGSDGAATGSPRASSTAEPAST